MVFVGKNQEFRGRVRSTDSLGGLQQQAALVSNQPDKTQGLHPLQTPQSMRGVPQRREHHKTYPPDETASRTKAAQDKNERASQGTASGMTRPFNSQHFQGFCLQLFKYVLGLDIISAVSGNTLFLFCIQGVRAVFGVVFVFKGF
ncbi:MAG: hypothetical protein HY394_02480 [Candidatus Diapherotrites archaeon]|nr:hypothetical protein [Candidatus Diapherotrites archaeon]